MPSGKNRHRMEVSEDVYAQVANLAAREGYTTTVFADSLMALAVTEYTRARRFGRYPFDHWLDGDLRGFCR